MGRSLNKPVSVGVAAILLIALFGCGGVFAFDKYAKGWVGHPLQSYLESNQYLRFDSEPGDIKHPVKLENGNWRYTVTDRKDCVIHWEVDSEDIIVDYRFEGDRCASN